VRRRPSPWMLRRTDSRSTEEPIMTSDSGRDMPSSPGPKLVPAVDHFEPPAPLTPSSLETIIQGFEGVNRIIETASRADKALTLVAVKLLRSRAGEWAVQELRERFPDLLEELDRLDEDLQKNPLIPPHPCQIRYRWRPHQSFSAVGPDQPPSRAMCLRQDSMWIRSHPSHDGPGTRHAMALTSSIATARSPVRGSSVG